MEDDAFFEDEEDEVKPRNTDIESGQWVIIELFGHKIVSGYMTIDEKFGTPMVRLDIPATSRYPAFSRHYNPSAIYSITYTNEEASKAVAENIKDNPVIVYIPELNEVSRLQAENRKMRERLDQFDRALSSGSIVKKA